MGGKYINKSQARLYMKLRKTQGLTQESAAAKVDISIRSARTIEHGKHHTSTTKNKIRSYKTRKSPVDKVWAEELEPMLHRDPALQPKTLLLYLQRNYLDKSGNPVYKDSVERTLQRRVASWQALNGKSKDIMFPQNHIPGHQGLSDFSHFTNAVVTINKTPFKHMLYHFRLVYSKWSFVKIIQSGESMQALSEGLQSALFCLGGSPKEHRTDSLSAAFKNISKDTKKDLTASYIDLCRHYNMEPTRNNKGKKHENGSVESAHGHLKNRMAQELILRSNNDFSSVLEYERWVQNIVANSNKRNSVNFEMEQLSLQPLPANKVIDFEVVSAKVSQLSVIIIKGMRYSVPSNFSGHTLTLHIYQHVIKVYLGSTPVFNMKRNFHTGSGSKFVINYKHIIHALIRKPGAFRNCQYREEIFPSIAYKKIWEYLDSYESYQAAPKMMLRLLKLAADYDCENALALHVTALITNNKKININSVETIFNLSNPPLPHIDSIQHDIKQYDFLINKHTPSGEVYATV
jgi:DNA-binding XRE family transcriptional regulator